jgi:H3 lysine-79-specific histone-lysine N-methyltransferase
MFRLVAEMCHRSGLKPGMNFLDLGCGIGNVVIQAALLSGCSSAGVENFPTTANIAAEVHQIFNQRSQMWGVEPGFTDIFEGDFMDPSSKLQSIIQNADVVLANNFVFEPTCEYCIERVFGWSNCYSSKRGTQETLLGPQRRCQDHLAS